MVKFFQISFRKKFGFNVKKLTLWIYRVKMNIIMRNVFQHWYLIFNLVGNVFLNSLIISKAIWKYISNKVENQILVLKYISHYDIHFECKICCRIFIFSLCRNAAKLKFYSCKVFPIQLKTEILVQVEILVKS